jgi:hypothetical protein
MSTLAALVLTSPDVSDAGRSIQALPFHTRSSVHSDPVQYRLMCSSVGSVYQPAFVVAIIVRSFAFV